MNGSAGMKAIALAGSAGLAAAGTWLVFQLLGWPPSLWMIPAAAAVFFCRLRFFRLPERRAKAHAFLLSFFFITFQMLGCLTADAAVPDGAAGMLRCAACGLTLAPSMSWPLTILLTRAAGFRGKPRRFPVSDRTFFFLSAAILLLLWLPVHLAYYPGLLEYDSGFQLWQTWNSSYDAANPLFHTFILGAFYAAGELAGSPSAGIAAFCCAQSLLMAFCIAHALRVLRRCGVRDGFLAGTLPFFGLLPVFSVMAISCTKDVPFYCLTLLQMSMIYDGCRNPGRASEWRYWVRLAAVTVSACLFRSNVLLPMLAVFPLVSLAVRSRVFRRRLAAVLTACTALAWLGNTVTVSVTRASKTPLRESLSVPILQMARVSYYYPEAQEILAEHEGMVEVPMAYIPFVADLAKWNFTVTGSNIGEFASVWARLLVRYPTDYIEAVLRVTRGYWYLEDDTVPRVYGNDISQHLGVLPSRISNGVKTIEEQSFLPALRDHFEAMYSANGYRNIPVYRLLFSPALYIWWLLLWRSVSRLRGSAGAGPVIRYALLLLTGLLLGPCCILRYALIFLLLAPVLPGMVLSENPTGDADRAS